MAYWQKGTIVDGNPGGRVNVDPNGADDIKFLSPKFVLNDGTDYGIVGYGLDLGTGGGVPADPFMIAGNRIGRLPTARQQATVAALQYGSSRVEDISPPYEIVGPVFGFPAWYSPTGFSGVNLGNDFPIEGASIQINDELPVMLNFGGSQAVTVADGTTAFNTHDPSIVIPANSKVCLITTWGPIPLNSYYPTAAYTVQPNAGGVSGGDGTHGGSVTQSARLTSGNFGAQTYNAGSVYGPCIMLAKGWKADGGDTPVGLGVGNSVGAGDADFTSVIAPSGIFGFVSRGLFDAATGRIPHVNWCIPGTRFSSLADVNTTDSQGTFAHRKAVIAYAKSLNNGYLPYTFVISEMGINTVANGVGANNTEKNAFVLAQAAAAHAYLKSLGPTPLSAQARVIQTTMTPQTIAFDDPGSTANYLQWSSSDMSKQLRANDAQHVALDDYLMGTPTNVDAVIDIRPFCEAGTARKWRQLGIAATLQAVPATGQPVISLDVSPQVGDQLIIEPGSASLYENVYVRSVTGSGPYSVTLKGNVSKTHTASAAVLGQSTQDGTHPSQRMTEIIAVAITDAKTAGVFNVS